MLRYFSFLVLVCVPVLEASIPIVPRKDIGGRIVNGEAAKEGQFPWQVAVLGSSTTYPSYLCGGALISDQWVLTAGHCVDGAIRASIYSGTIQIQATNKTTSLATDFILHEDFDGISLSNDIGLIKLRDPLTLNDITQPITLAEQELEADVNVTISGWGSISDTDTTAYSTQLNYATVSTISNTLCNSIFGTQFLPSVVCTLTIDDPVKSPCNGDSGGPVVAYVDDKPVHAAIFSFVNGIGCEEPYPAGNTRTAYYRDWIKEKTGI